jgi:large conductance mechanosensitive channel
MPPIGIALGGVDFKDLAFTLQEAQEGSAAVVIGYGMFIQSVVDFVIISFCIFMVVKAYNSMQKAKEAAPAEPSDEVKLLTEIRDALKK